MNVELLGHSAISALLKSDLVIKHKKTFSSRNEFNLANSLLFCVSFHKQ